MLYALGIAVAGLVALAVAWFVLSLLVRIGRWLGDFASRFSFLIALVLTLALANLLFGNQLFKVRMILSDAVSQD